MTALGPLDELVGYHLRRASSAMKSDFAQTFAETAMRQVLFGVLSVVSAAPGTSQGKVGEALGIQRANMVALVNDLVDLGLVARKTARRDRRAFSLNLTPAGEAKLREMLEQIRTHEDRMLQNLTTEERETLIALLRKVHAPTST
ncbi:MarR family winged helix-turn-helix transcriptional regulator [Sphingobium lignivorans]|uniref:DNA-binding MarR family transcriptional regulator n=1 Tax=Sphingobium lignivorans TaxID=2735886 RepID=A0ABR6NBX3_9SPHN|nr:MarR family transcriptional regulator [Sphingobium lignivorans]MBB5984793.1 DNA-binding MarR family transcriptional regulator [Sphingobium lignivorans]